MSCDLYCGFRVTRIVCLVARALLVTTVVGSRVCTAENCDVYVSYGPTSEAIGHVSMRSATATATSIKEDGRDVVVRTIVSELGDI